MKNLTVAIILTIFTGPRLFAQWTTSGSNIYNSNTGNIGVGTTSPLEKIHIQNGNLLLTGNNDFSSIQGTLKFSTSTFAGSFAGISGTTNDAGRDQLDLIFWTCWGPSTEKMRIMSTGNVGIGTSTPQTKLSIQANTNDGLVSFLNSAGVRKAYIGTAVLDGQMIPGSTSSDLIIRSESQKIMFSADAGTTSHMTLGVNGNLGIGTSAPLTKLDVRGNVYSNGKVYIGASADANTATNMGSNLLAVEGSALFNKVIVKTPLWPDYVFSPTYKLTPLDSLQQFIQIHKHLPEVPSAKDVQKDGIDLGDNQALLLKKIEELTLIVIEQNKRIEKLEKGHK